MLLTAPAIAIVVMAVIFAFMNGAKDGGNALATIITSRSMRPAAAIVTGVVAQFLGPYLFGIAVAKTVGSGIAQEEAITATVVLAALTGATAWNAVMWWLSIPTSSSHALVGGIVGAVLVATGFNLGMLKAPGLLKVAAGLFGTPIVAMAGAYAIMFLATLLLRSATPRANWFFKRGQIVTMLGLALSFGANDPPKAMAMISMGLLSLGLIEAFEVPGWVIALCSGSVALGTLLGSWRMVRTLGTRFYRVRPLHAFNSQLTAGLLVIGASLLGAPVSTSQVVSSAIVGAGAAERLTRVRWGVMGEIVNGWLLTIPTSAVVSGLIYVLLSRWLGH